MKRVLLIAGGGTLGLYTARALLEAGHRVDILCLEDHCLTHPRLRFFRLPASPENLTALFQENRYDGIVNFLHYPDARTYIPHHELLSQNTDHLIFLSSYRVYADLQHPITETAPQLIDTAADDLPFIRQERYALSKSRAEKLLHQSRYRNWTVVRPVISFSQKRLDLIMASGHEIPRAAAAGTEMTLPLEARNLTAGLDWAGNSGKLIAGLLFQQQALGEAYTVSSAQNLTWGTVADFYREFLPIRFRWAPADYPDNVYQWHYDRAYDRAIDNRKILEATGFTASDFTGIREGIALELNQLRTGKGWWGI